MTECYRTRAFASLVLTALTCVYGCAELDGELDSSPTTLNPNQLDPVGRPKSSDTALRLGSDAGTTVFSVDPGASPHYLESADTVGPGTTKASTYSWRVCKTKTINKSCGGLVVAFTVGYGAYASLVSATKHSYQADGYCDTYACKQDGVINFIDFYKSIQICTESSILADIAYSCLISG